MVSHTLVKAPVNRSQPLCTRFVNRFEDSQLFLPTLILSHNSTCQKLFAVKSNRQFGPSTVPPIGTDVLCTVPFVYIPSHLMVYVQC